MNVPLPLEDREIAFIVLTMLVVVLAVATFLRSGSPSASARGTPGEVNIWVPALTL